MLNVFLEQPMWPGDKKKDLDYVHENLVSYFVCLGIIMWKREADLFSNSAPRIEKPEGAEKQSLQCVLNTKDKQKWSDSHP